MVLKQIYKYLCPQKIQQSIITRKLYNQNKEKIESTFLHYDDVLKSVQKKKVLSFGSYVVYDSTFGAAGLMDILLQEKERYSVKFVIIPDVSRGLEHMVSQYKNTKKFFLDKYGEAFVLDGYDIENQQFLDNSSLFDIVYMANPYDSMVNHLHSVDYMSTQNLLPIHINYCFQPDKYSNTHIMQRLELSLFWKVFAETTFTYKDYKTYEIIHGRNVVLSGYAKMDELAKIDPCIKQDKKTIIIAPHHTINNGLLPLSNFDKYADFFLKLPDLYPNINFIFRPHPLLFTTLIKEGVWTNEKVEEYITELREKNVYYSTGGDYFKIFAESDAIIHDCSSYIVEYLFTKKPGCFMAKKDNKQYLNQLGIKCLKYYTKAFDQKDIISFIENVNKEDRIKLKKIDKFLKKNISINYPNVSQFIYSQMNKEFIKRATYDRY